MVFGLELQGPIVVRIGLFSFPLELCASDTMLIEGKTGTPCSPRVVLALKHPYSIALCIRWRDTEDSSDGDYCGAGTTSATLMFENGILSTFI